LISPSQQWLAIISVGEGHPIIDIVELPKFLQNNEPKTLLSINPFPGTIDLIKWRANQLVVESDRLISQHNEALARVEKFYVTIDKTNQVSLLPASTKLKVVP
jgi:hypothetical protein